MIKKILFFTFLVIAICANVSAISGVWTVSVSDTSLHYQVDCVFREGYVYVFSKVSWEWEKAGTFFEMPGRWLNFNIGESKFTAATVTGEYTSGFCAIDATIQVSNEEKYVKIPCLFSMEIKNE
jgi:hypothetical protein